MGPHALAPLDMGFIERCKAGPAYACNSLKQNPTASKSEASVVAVHCLAFCRTPSAENG
jgi:hypothetical protein